MQLVIIYYNTKLSINKCFREAGSELVDLCIVHYGFMCIACVCAMMSVYLYACIMNARMYIFVCLLYKRDKIMDYKKTVIT